MEPSASGSHRVGGLLSPSRLEAFSDGVFATVMAVYYAVIRVELGEDAAARR